MEIHILWLTLASLANTQVVRMTLNYINYNTYNHNYRGRSYVVKSDWLCRFPTVLQIIASKLEPDPPFWGLARKTIGHND